MDSNTIPLLTEYLRGTRPHQGEKESWGVCVGGGESERDCERGESEGRERERERLLGRGGAGGDGWREG